MSAPMRLWWWSFRDVANGYALAPTRAKAGGAVLRHLRAAYRGSGSEFPGPSGLYVRQEGVGRYRDGAPVRVCSFEDALRWRNWGL